MVRVLEGREEEVEEGGVVEVLVGAPDVLGDEQEQLAVELFPLVGEAQEGAEGVEGGSR